jgi:hypothetical protein
VHGSYVASGGEDHLVIGNFRDDASTTWEMFNPGVWYANTSYLLVDDVSLVRNAVNAVELGPDTLLCGGASITLNTAVPGATGVLWNDGSTDPIRTVVAAGEYAVTVQFGVCSVNDTVVVTTAPEPWIELGPDLALCPRLATDLVATANGSIVWDDGTMGYQRMVSAPGTYRASTSNACGAAMDSVMVFTEECPEGIYLPNAFTPDGDGINDGFAPVYDRRLWQVGYSVHDRWGHQVYSDAAGEAWPGSGLPSGVYVVYLTAHALAPAGANAALNHHVVLIH